MTEMAPLSVVLVTGLSGAGKTTALHTLEDLGYETVDNIPLSLLRNLLRPPEIGVIGSGRPLAIGVDFRTRDFAPDAFLDEVAALAALPEIAVTMLFIDCEEAELARRYKETRRRHPLALDRPVLDGIRQERTLMMPIRQIADVILDSTVTNVTDFSRLVRLQFAPDAPQGLTVFVTSFGFRNGLPRDADLVFDVRFLANPHYDPDLRPLTGEDSRIADYVAADQGFTPFFNSLTDLLVPLLPRYREEGKSYLTIAIGCTGGRHRSVFVARRLADYLQAIDWPVILRHRDLVGP